MQSAGFERNGKGCNVSLLGHIAPFVLFSSYENRNCWKKCSQVIFSCQTGRLDIVLTKRMRCDVFTNETENEKITGQLVYRNSGKTNLSKIASICMLMSC